MLSRKMTVAVAALSAIWCTGCSMLPASSSDEPGPIKRIAEKLNEDSNKDDPEDPWAVAGKEGRGDQVRERDPDQWYRRYFMSSQARAIERNMGID